MKKLTILLGLLLFLFSPYTVFAKPDNAGSQKGPNVNASEIAKEKTVTAKLKKIVEESEDPEVVAEVEEIVVEQEVVENEADQAMNQTSDRPAAVKFLIGPDYKNLGMLRSQVVHTRNNIKKLEKTLERADEADKPAIEAALLELEESSQEMQANIYSKLGEFSLFGWLFRWLSGFTPPEEVIPSMTPTSTPIGSATPTPEGTITPTPEVTQEPSPTPTP